MDKIVYSGFYGFKNSGDDAFLEVCAWGSKVILNSNKTYFLGSDLPILQNESKSLTKPKFKGHDRLQGFINLLDANYFISAGGSTFSGYKSYSFKGIAEIVKKKFNKQLKTGAIGVSIGPFSSLADEKNVAEYLKRLNFLIVRDRRSYDFISSLNLPYKPIEAFDLAALLPEVYKGQPILPKVQDKKIIGVSLCKFESVSNIANISNENRRNDEIKKIILDLNNTNESVVFRFFIFNGHPVIGDREVTLNFISKLELYNYEIIEYQNSVKKTWDYIGQCDFMIATRLHAAIFSAYNKVPFILIEYHQKCTDFLIDIGQDNSFLVGDAYFDYQKISYNISQVLNGINSFSLKNLERTINMAHKNFLFNE